MFGRILIANRGEIARRVIRACRKLGIESVAVHSAADREAAFVREADHALCIGPARARDSYLDADALLEAAFISEAHAVHPGYGFLSENALFAQRVLGARLGWIGPPPALLRLMGEKAKAKAAMAAEGLPPIPGSEGVLESVDQAVALAASFGYPVLLKADSGGGGKGLRRADDEAELRSAWDSAGREADAAFGSPKLYLEKFLEHCRHIEFQFLADRHGNGVHLFERECSIQRRHQKLVEEAPSSILTPTEREEMGAKVARAMSRLGYSGAGTVEFLREGASGRLFFIETNARIQVEHPVTEEITGFDLVEAQIRIAAGEPLWITQEDLRVTGHAIEMRINAEDPEDGFRPSPGRVDEWAAPAASLGSGRVRVDSAVESGDQVSPHYDSLLGKLIAWGPDRAAAIETSRLALDQILVSGVASTIPMHRAILASEDFAKGNLVVGEIPGWVDGES